ncbi:MAG: amidohydrolase family protein [Planctomycetes bacterium]|nr:amidohydrolase family protein [Planctomycetota bacterium]
MSAQRIDAHQHFWRLARGDYGWLEPGMGPLYRDFEPADLAPLLARAGIARSIAVQAAPSAAETDHLLALAARTSSIAGVVGWIDFESPRALEELAQRRRHPRFVGVRPMIQDILDERWMLKPALAPVFEALEKHGLAFDALVRPAQLDALCELVQRHPRLRVVVDHGAKPSIAQGSGWDGRARWQERMRALARSGASVKISGLLSEARPGAGLAELAPYVDTLLECFGPARVLWGSDWPVLLGVADYERWWELSLELLRALSHAELERVLGGNAVDFYRLEAA